MEAMNKEETIPKPVYHWCDITDEFVEASTELKLGELLHDSLFGLFEAMSAIEMMDPKMDAGMMCNQITRKVLNFEQSIETGTVKIKDLTHEELIGIMDSSLSCLVTWLEGHSLAQTVFTDLYLHNPYIIEDRCLKAVSICTLKIVDLIKDRITRASVFEEEDFQPMSYGFKMASDVTDVRASGMLKEIEDELNRLIKTTRTKPGQEHDDAREKEHNLAVAVYSRVKFYRMLFVMLTSFSKEKSEGVPQAQKLIVQLHELLPAIKSSIPLGLQAENREITKNDYSTIMGFEPLINQRLLPPTFPRYTMIKCRDDSVDYIEKLLDRLNIATQLQQTNSLHAILELFMEFSKSSPCVLSRSLLQLSLFSPNRRVFGIHPIVDYLKDTIRSFIAPPALNAKCSIYNNSQAKDYIDALLTHAVRSVCTLFQICGHNRARQRDKWAHALEDLSNLQEEADKVDAFLHSLLIKTEPSRQHLACFGTWVLYHTLNTMINYTLSGFELELYATYEYHYIYWYLSELLYAWLLSTLHRADNFLLEHEALTEQQGKGRSNKRNKKKKRTKSLNKEITVAQAYQQLFGGYYKAIVGFQIEKKLTEPEFEFDSEEVRYNHRFAPFATVMTPPNVQYAQYKDMSEIRRYEPDPQAETLYSASCKCFQQSRALFESLPTVDSEIQTIIKVAKTNFVVMKLLVGGHKKNSKDPPEFDFTQHNVLPVIKFVPLVADHTWTGRP